MATIRDARDEDLPRILEITNYAILNTTAVWSLQPTTLDARRQWLADRTGQGYPVLVADDGGALGFATFGDFRPWDGYRHTVEHSLYVHAAARGRGLGSALLDALIWRAAGLGKHVMVAGIDADNAVSIRLHEKHGFEKTGHLRQVGRKFDRWLDLVFMQRFLDGA